MFETFVLLTNWLKKFDIGWTHLLEL